MPNLSTSHIALANELNGWWTTGLLPQDSHLQALAERSHGGNLLHAALYAAVDLSAAVNKASSTPTPDGVMLFEKTETLVGEVDVVSLYPVSTRYMPADEDDDADVDLFDILDQADKDAGGDLQPLRQSHRLVRTHSHSTCHIDCWHPGSDA